MNRLAPMAVIALLAAGLTGFTGIRASAAPQAAQPTPRQTCVLIIICFPSSPSSSPSSPAAPSLPLPTPSLPLPTPSLAAAGAVDIRAPSLRVGLDGQVGRERLVAVRPPVAVSHDTEGRQGRPRARGVQRHVDDDHRLRDADRVHLQGQRQPAPGGRRNGVR